MLEKFIERDLSHESQNKMKREEESAIRRRNLLASLDNAVEKERVDMVVRNELVNSGDKKAYYTIAKQDDQYIASVLQFDEEDSDGYASAIIAVDSDIDQVRTFFMNTGHNKRLLGSESPNVNRPIIYIRTALALLLDLIEKHPEFSIIDAWPEDAQRARAYAILEKYGFIKEDCDEKEETPSYFFYQ
jgi:hypothetical protein